eukprot:1778239-Rhodomonas_salina.2
MSASRIAPHRYATAPFPRSRYTPYATVRMQQHPCSSTAQSARAVSGSGLEVHVSRVTFRVSSFRLRFRVPGFRFQGSGRRFRASNLGFGFRGSAFENRDKFACEGAEMVLGAVSRSAIHPEISGKKSNFW